MGTRRINRRCGSRRRTCPPRRAIRARLTTLSTGTTSIGSSKTGSTRPSDRAWHPGATSACWVGYVEGIDSERGIAWRATDSLAVRSFLRLAVDEAPPDHSTIARTRRLIDLETPRTVFTWVQQRLVEAGRLTGKTIAIDATTLEANAAMRSIVRRDTGESYQAFLAGLTASGIETPTREGLARLDRKRKKKTSNTA